MVVSLFVSERSHLHQQRKPFLYPVCSSRNLFAIRILESVRIVNSSILRELKIEDKN